MIKKGSQVYFLHCYAIEGTTNENKMMIPINQTKLLENVAPFFRNLLVGFSHLVLETTS